MKRYFFLFSLSYLQASCGVPDDVWDRLMHKGYPHAATRSIAGHDAGKKDTKNDFFYTYWKLEQRIVFPEYTPTKSYDDAAAGSETPEQHVLKLIDAYIDNHDLEDPLHRLLENTYLSQHLRNLANLVPIPEDAHHMLEYHPYLPIGRAMLIYEGDTCRLRERSLILDSLVLRPGCCMYQKDIELEFREKLLPYSENADLREFIEDIIDYNVNRADYKTQLVGLEDAQRDQICAYLDYLTRYVDNCCAIMIGTAPGVVPGMAAAARAERFDSEDDSDSSTSTDSDNDSIVARGQRTPDLTEPDSMSAGLRPSPAAFVASASARSMSPPPPPGETAQRLRFATQAICQAQATSVMGRRTAPAAAATPGIASAAAEPAESGAGGTQRPSFWNTLGQARFAAASF